jgi:uncharacterized membrane protein
MAAAINERGEIAGIGERGSIDRSCPPPQVFHFAAVVWSAGGAVRELPALSGDPDANASGINNDGDVSGASGICTFDRVTAVVWRRGAPVALPTLGGVTGNIAFAINDSGDAVGQSDLAGDMTHHAALWHAGAVTDLGTIHGLPVSLANGINNKRQIVGFSQDLQSNNTVAELWQGDATWDLNSVVSGSTHLFLVEALGINDRGQIAGYGLNTTTNEIHGFLATPASTNSLQSAAQSARTETLTPVQRRIIRAAVLMRGFHVPWPRTSTRDQ